MQRLLAHPVLLLTPHPGEGAIPPSYTPSNLAHLHGKTVTALRDTGSDRPKQRKIYRGHVQVVPYPDTPEVEPHEITGSHASSAGGGTQAIALSRAATAPVAELAFVMALPVQPPAVPGRLLAQVVESRLNAYGTPGAARVRELGPESPENK
ncbi:hypothetical protein BJF83_21435 [Nocardiopsis sp. CNR-923]|uniref:hypothetical protein n=1 Tax=Nocardiopsis sp. CNR-923 TaxID=1904965 RepID=UPI00095ED131|nr:hypothetical protein [Nocardiopsis sp. CNR-923]OLT26366.1 hypothetical protein BJF83_21435 [Nocardiopsis sp. CNR-923]